MIRKHEGSNRTLQERRDMLDQFNDMTRTFNFTKNMAHREFKDELLSATKLSPKLRKKFYQTNNLAEKFGIGNNYTSGLASPESAKELDSGGFFVT